MRKILTILVTVIFLLAPIAFAEDANETIAEPMQEVTSEVTPEVITEPTTEGNSDVAAEDVSESNLSETESEAITDTISAGGTEATEEVSVTPDMPLRWGLKTWSEKFSLLLTFNKYKKAEKKLEHARERLQEMKQMADRKNLKALAKAQRAHASIVAELSQDEETLADEDLTAAEKVETELQKHIQVLEGVQEKLTAKGVPTQGVDNALVKSRNALDKFKNMNETRKAKLAEKVVNRAEKVSERKEQIKEKVKERLKEESEDQEEESEEQEDVEDDSEEESEQESSEIENKTE